MISRSGILITIIILITSHFISYIESQTVNNNTITNQNTSLLSSNLTNTNTDNSIPVPIKESQTSNFICSNAYASPIEIVIILLKK